LKIRWRIRDFKNQSKEHLYPSDLTSREVSFREKYDLDSLYGRSRAATYKINLYVLDLLERFFGDRLDRFGGRAIRVLDAGSDDWHYVRSLWSFLNFWSARVNFSFHLTGLEVDPYRMGKNLHTRLDYAEAYSRGLRNTAYKQGNVLDMGGRFDIVFAFLPFVTRKEAAGWRLSLKYYDPVKFFGHLYDCLKPESFLLVVNVNRYESLVMKEILQEIEVKPLIPPTRFNSPFFAYRTDRYVTLVEKRRSFP
jgi:hypothetical protein